MDASDTKNAGATAAAEAVARPVKHSYTPPDNEKSTPMTDAPGEQASALDRKLAEGLNALHLHSRLDRVERETQRLDQSVSRLEHEVLEFRRETRASFARLEETRRADLDRWEETRKADNHRVDEARKADFAELKADIHRLHEAHRTDFAELKADIQRLDEAHRANIQRLDEAHRADFHRLDEAHRADFAELKEMIRALTEQVQKNAEQTAIALERSAGFAWTQRRLAVGVLLLVAGALLGALGRMALAAFGVG